MSLWVRRHRYLRLLVRPADCFPCRSIVYPDIDNGRRRNLLLGNNRHIQERCLEIRQSHRFVDHVSDLPSRLCGNLHSEPVDPGYPDTGRSLGDWTYRELLCTFYCQRPLTCPS
jgi:hypothetical protein